MYVSTIIINRFSYVSSTKWNNTMNRFSSESIECLFNFSFTDFIYSSMMNISCVKYVDSTINGQTTMLLGCFGILVCTGCTPAIKGQGSIVPKRCNNTSWLPATKVTIVRLCCHSDAICYSYIRCIFRSRRWASVLLIHILSANKSVHLYWNYRLICLL